MQTDSKHPTPIVRAAASSDAGVRFLRFDLCALARAAEVSPTLAARFIRGCHVGPRSAARIRAALGLDADQEVVE